MCHHQVAGVTDQLQHLVTRHGAVERDGVPVPLAEVVARRDGGMPATQAAVRSPDSQSRSVTSADPWQRANSRLHVLSMSGIVSASCAERIVLRGTSQARHARHARARLAFGDDAESRASSERVRAVTVGRLRAGYGVTIAGSCLAPDLVTRRPASRIPPAPSPATLAARLATPNGPPARVWQPRTRRQISDTAPADEQNTPTGTLPAARYQAGASVPTGRSARVAPVQGHHVAGGRAFGLSCPRGHKSCARPLARPAPADRCSISYSAVLGGDGSSGRTRVRRSWPW